MVRGKGCAKGGRVNWWTNPAKRKEALEFSVGVFAAAMILALGILLMIAL